MVSEWWIDRSHIDYHVASGMMSDVIKKIAFALVLVFRYLGRAVVPRVIGWPEVTQAFEHNEPFWVVDPDLKAYAMPHNEENTSFKVSTNPDGL